jgi:hypothetical protein
MASAGRRFDPVLDHNPFPFAISAKPTAIPHDGEGRRRTHSTDEDSDTLPCGPAASFILPLD